MVPANTLNKILVDIGQIIGQSWSELVDICPEIFLVKAPRVKVKIFENGISILVEKECDLKQFGNGMSLVNGHTSFDMF